MAPSTYYANKARPPSARACRDAVIGPALRQLWEDNYRVYGARKLWKAARRAGHDVGRDQVARHMRAAGIAGTRRGNGSAPPDLTPPPRVIPIWWAGISPPPRPMRCGSPTYNADVGITGPMPTLGICRQFLGWRRPTAVLRCKRSA